jgi:prevent-host-death family protein
MQNQWNVQDAKNKFSEVITAACKGRPQVVTKRGAPSVVVLAVDAYEQLVACSKSSSSSFADFLLSIPGEPSSAGCTEAASDTHTLAALRDVDF